MANVTGTKTGQTKASKRKKCAPSGVAFISSTFNNTIITIANVSGDVIAWASGGMKQKGTRKATAHAAEESATLVGHKVSDMGMVELHVVLRGPGSGRDSAIRGLSKSGLKVLSISDKTPVPHNGCRKRKKKRN